VSLRHTTVFVSDLSMTRVITSLFAHDADVSHEGETRCRNRNDDLARSLITICSFRISDRHDYREARPISGRCEPLVTVNDVVGTVFHRGGAHPGRIRSGMFWLSHREATAHLATRERHKIVFLLLL